MSDTSDSPRSELEAVQRYPKNHNFFGLSIPPWRSPFMQVILTGFVCFLCPGMFNALNGLGAGGQVESSVTSNALVALYTTFAVFGFVAGTGLNYFGARPTLAFGGLGYALYSASLLCYNHTANSGFVIFSGAMLGVCAAFLWCAQGTVMMSYPTESEKGRYIGLFWGIFNMGAVIGSISPIVQNWKTPSGGAVNDGTYVGFLALMVAGAVLAFFLVPPHQIVRKDGTRVAPVRHPSAVSEIKGLYETLKSDYYILLLFPMFWASNWFYTYQQNCYNLYLFNLRGRAFNNIWYWLAQIIGAVLFGVILDNQRLGSRKMRAWIGWGILFVVVNVIWGGGFVVLDRYSDERAHLANAAINAARTKAGLPIDASLVLPPAIDVYGDNFAAYCFLYLFYGFLDAMWQTYAYWLMGALSNDPRKLAYFAGFYKGIQSAGAAVVWRLDATGHSFDSLFGSSWGLCVAGMLFALPVIYLKVQDTELTDADFVTEGHAAGARKGGSRGKSEKEIELDDTSRTYSG
ncbi:major facilitator superfamily domain-containing protein [Peziza echinospora]|nr:major facilitator superfamily domain-containing protein [Peziza echinospora]